MRYSEIFKEYVNGEYPDHYVTKEEWDKVKALVGNNYRYCDDQANGYFAIALPMVAMTPQTNLLMNSTICSMMSSVGMWAIQMRNTFLFGKKC